MKILLHEDIKLDFQDMAHRVHRDHRLVQPRSGGVHLTGVLKQWALESQVLEPSEWDEEQGEYPLLWALGQMWEEFCVSLYPYLTWQPGPWQREGVIGNPDGLSNLVDIDPTATNEHGYPHTELVIEECKLTKKSCKDDRDIPALSSRQGVVDWWSRIQQVLGYGNVMDTAPRRRLLARFHVLYVNGDYRGIEPRYRRTLVEFSQQELVANWANVKKYARKTAPEKGQRG